jgi:hypothetical protein
MSKNAKIKAAFDFLDRERQLLLSMHLSSMNIFSPGPGLVRIVGGCIGMTAATGVAVAIRLWVNDTMITILPITIDEPMFGVYMPKNLTMGQVVQYRDVVIDLDFADSYARS